MKKIKSFSPAIPTTESTIEKQDMYWHGGDEIRQDITDSLVSDVIFDALKNIIWCGNDKIVSAYESNDVDMHGIITGELIDQLAEVLSVRIDEDDINIYTAAIIAAKAAIYIDAHAKPIEKDKDSDSEEGKNTK